MTLTDQTNYNQYIVSSWHVSGQGRGFKPASQLLLRMREGGPLTVWQQKVHAKVRSPDCIFNKIGDHLWLADVPGVGEKLVHIRDTSRERPGQRIML